MNPDDMKILSSLADIIRKNGSISPEELWKNSDLSISQFKEIKKYILVLFEDIKLDRKHKKYISRNNISNFVEENLK